MKKINDPCSVGDCPRPYYARGFCHLHYQRWRRKGTTDLDHRPDVQERFSSQLRRRKPRKGQKKGCLLWTGAQDGRGYGKLWVNGRLEQAHRVSWYLTTGEWPTQPHLRHTCDTPLCCEYEHLLEGTALDNQRDALERGRHVSQNYLQPRGERGRYASAPRPRKTRKPTKT